jgi:hypothetical protein
VKTPWQYLRGVVQGSAETPGRVAAAISAWSEGTLPGAAEGDRAWLHPVQQHPEGPAADQELLPNVIRLSRRWRKPLEVQLSVDTAVEAPCAGFMNLRQNSKRSWRVWPPKLVALSTRLRSTC